MARWCKITMLNDEENKAIEQAISSVTRGVDIESAMLILEKCVLDGLIITRGRINIFKIAVRQIVEFLKEYKDKGYLDVVREKVKANETVEKHSKEIEELKAISEYREKIIKGLGLKTLPKTIVGFKELIENNDKKWEDKIKAKIEEVERWELYNMKIPRLSTLDERLGAKIGIKYVLQSLLGKE